MYVGWALERYWADVYLQYADPRAFKLNAPQSWPSWKSDHEKAIAYRRKVSHVGDSPNNGQIKLKLVFLATKENALSGANSTHLSTLKALSLAACCGNVFNQQRL